MPVKDVIKSFNFIKSKAQENFLPIIEYFENFYFGKLVSQNEGVRFVPQFEIENSNVFNLVFKKLPRSNNSIEAWHKYSQSFNC